MSERRIKVGNCACPHGCNEVCDDQARCPVCWNEGKGCPILFGQRGAEHIHEVGTDKYIGSENNCPFCKLPGLAPVAPSRSAAPGESVGHVHSPSDPHEQGKPCACSAAPPSERAAEKLREEFVAQIAAPPSKNTAENLIIARLGFNAGWLARAAVPQDARQLLITAQEEIEHLEAKVRVLEAAVVPAPGETNWNKVGFELRHALFEYRKTHQGDFPGFEEMGVMAKHAYEVSGWMDAGATAPPKEAEACKVSGYHTPAAPDEGGKR